MQYKVRGFKFPENVPMPKCFDSNSGFITQINDTFTKYLWPITCSLLVAHNALIAMWHLYTVFFVDTEYGWEKHYFVTFGLIVAVFVVSFSHKHFIIRE